jgi:tetratricopeptide (TPR) repeat protein
MKADLAAKMGDEAQSWINSYLRGQINNNTTKCKEDLNRYISYLKTVEQLIGKKNLRYNKIHAKRLFFEAYLLKLDGKNAKLMEALTKIQEANKKMPGQAYLYNCWGLILDDLNKTDSAILLYEAALTLSPKWAIPFSNLGAVMQKKKKYLPSEDYLKKAINLDSNYAMAYNNLGYLYSEINKINDAEKLFRKAIEIDSNLKFAYLNLAVLLKGEKKYMESLVLLDKSIKIDPEFKLGLLSLAEINIILKNYEIAEFSLKKVIEIDPNNSEIYFNLGLLYQIQKKFQLAENCYLFAWDINPKLFEAIKRLGEVLYEQQKYTESIAYYQKAIKFNKEKGNIYYNISCNFALLKNKSEALKYLEMAINNGFNDLNTLKNDTDLTSIRDEKRYKFLEEKLSKK